MHRHQYFCWWTCGRAGPADQLWTAQSPLLWYKQVPQQCTQEQHLCSGKYLYLYSCLTFMLALEIHQFGVLVLNKLPWLTRDCTWGTEPATNCAPGGTLDITLATKQDLKHTYIYSFCCIKNNSGVSGVNDQFLLCQDQFLLCQDQFLLH